MSLCWLGGCTGQGLWDCSDPPSGGGSGAEGSVGICHSPSCWLSRRSHSSWALLLRPLKPDLLRNQIFLFCFLFMERAVKKMAKLTPKQKAIPPPPKRKNVSHPKLLLNPRDNGVWCAELWLCLVMILGRLRVLQRKLEVQKALVLWWKSVCQHYRGCG